MPTNKQQGNAVYFIHTSVVEKYEFNKNFLEHKQA